MLPESPREHGVPLNQRGHDDGVSSVVSAVLVFALFSTASMLYALNTLPDRIEAKEAENQGRVREAFGSLKANLEALSAAGDTGPVSATLPLAAQPVAFLQRGQMTGSLQVQEGAFGLNASWPAGTVAHLLNGQAVGAPTQAMPGTLSNVASFRSLVLGMQSNGINGGGRTATLTATASLGGTTVTATLTHSSAAVGICGTGASITYALQVTGQATRTRSLACAASSSAGSAGDPYRLDLLDDSLGFNGALARLGGPFSLTLTASAAGGGASVVGTFSAVYLDAEGLVQVAGTGQAYTTVLNQTGDVLRYTPNPFRYVRQEVAWQGGAVVADQGPTSQAIIAAPAFVLDASSSRGHLQWTVATLDGHGSRGGSDVATVTLTHTSTNDLLLAATQPVTLTVTTTDPQAWVGMINASRLLGGLTSTQVMATAGNGTVTLTLVPTAGLSAWTVSLRLVQGQVTVT